MNMGTDMSEASNQHLMKGMSNLDKILGVGRIKYIQRLDSLLEGLGDNITELVYGRLYENDVLDLRTRQLVNIALMLERGDNEQLAFHVQCALNLGITKEQVIEVIIQSISIIGIPKALHALSVSREYLNSMYQE